MLEPKTPPDLNPAHSCAEPLSDLLVGYREFRRDHYAAEAERYHSLALLGQAPRTMVIACSDSRVDPSRIFNARPGELFVVRNVANLVPPYEEHGSYHGTSAAIEFAVTMLHVEQIVVLGHARCGGVRAFLDNCSENAPPKSFLDNWISLLRPAYEAAGAKAAPNERTAREQWMEKLAITHSLGNLMTFPFVREAIQGDRLKLFGALFDISTGHLLVLNRRTAEFQTVAI